MRGRRRHRKKALQRMEMDLRGAPREHFYTAGGVRIPWWFALSDQQIVELVTAYLSSFSARQALARCWTYFGEDRRDPPSPLSLERVQ